MARVVKEPLGAVVVEAVVHLVAEGGAVVGRLNQVSGQVDPLARAVVGVDKDLVAGSLPVLLLPGLIRQTYSIVEGHHLKIQLLSNGKYHGTEPPLQA